MTEQRNNTVWTGKEINTAMHLAAEGVSNADIALELNRTTSAICAKLWHMQKQTQGISRRKGAHVVKSTPGDVNVKPTVKQVTQKATPVGSKRTVTTGTNNTAVGNHYFIVRVPKVFVAASLLLGVAAVGWYIGRGF